MTDNYICTYHDRPKVFIETLGPDGILLGDTSCFSIESIGRDKMVALKELSNGRIIYGLGKRQFKGTVTLSRTLPEAEGIDKISVRMTIIEPKDPTYAILEMKNIKLKKPIQSEIPYSVCYEYESTESSEYIPWKKFKNVTTKKY